MPNPKDTMTSTHILKTDPEVFDDVERGAKLHEIRFDDRGYQVGDILHLRRTQHTGAAMRDGAPLIYNGDLLKAVTHILRGPIYGLAEGWVIMSIADLRAARGLPEEHVHIELPSGAMASVTPDGAKDPQLIGALDQMMQAVAKAAAKGKLPKPANPPAMGAEERAREVIRIRSHQARIVTHPGQFPSLEEAIAAALTQHAAEQNAASLAEIARLKEELEAVRTSVLRLHNDRDDRDATLEAELDALIESKGLDAGFWGRAASRLVTKRLKVEADRDSLRARLDAVSGVVKSRGHSQGCAAFEGDGAKCDCWLSSILAALQPKGDAKV